MRYSPLVALNITPFVDILLILCLTLILAIPAVLTAMPVTLPNSQEASNLKHQANTLDVVITARGAIFVKNSEVSLTSLTTISSKYTMANLYADANTTVSKLISVGDALSRAGVKNISIISQ